MVDRVAVRLRMTVDEWVLRVRDFIAAPADDESADRNYTDTLLGLLAGMPEGDQLDALRRLDAPRPERKYAGLPRRRLAARHWIERERYKARCKRQE